MKKLFRCVSIIAIWNSVYAMTNLYDFFQRNNLPQYRYEAYSELQRKMPADISLSQAIKDGHLPAELSQKIASFAIGSFNPIQPFLYQTLHTYKHLRSITSIAVSSDNSFIVTVSVDAINIWDTRTGRLLHTLSGHQAGINSVAISPDNSFIVTEFYDNTAKIWNARTGDLLHTLSGHTGWISSVAISPDNTFIVTGSFDRTTKIWNTQDGRILHTLASEAAINSVAISPNNSFIITGSDKNTPKIWDTQTGELLQTLTGDPGHQLGINSVTISSDNSFIVTVSVDATKIWDARTGNILHTIVDQDRIKSVAISPNNSFIITISNDTVKIWNPRTGRLLHTLTGDPGHQLRINSATISSDNSFIVTVSNDRAKIWNTQTGRSLYDLAKDQDYGDIKSVAISPNNLCIVTGFEHGVKIWMCREPTWVREWINSLMTLPQALFLTLLLAAQKPDTPLSLRLLAQKNNLDYNELHTEFASIAGPNERKNKDLHIRNFFIKFFDLRK